MFDIDSSELVVVGVVALLVIGPKDLPRVLRTVGQWVGRARGMARHVRAGFDTMVREAEIEEMNQRWQAGNKAIMAALPQSPETPAWAEPVHDRIEPHDAVEPAAASHAPGLETLPAPDAAHDPAQP